MLAKDVKSMAGASTYHTLKTVLDLIVVNGEIDDTDVDDNWGGEITTTCSTARETRDDHYYYPSASTLSLPRVFVSDNLTTSRAFFAVSSYVWYATADDNHLTLPPRCYSHVMSRDMRSGRIVHGIATAARQSN